MNEQQQLRRAWHRRFRLYVALIGSLPAWAACSADTTMWSERCLASFDISFASFEMAVGDSIALYGRIIPGCGHEKPIDWVSDRPDIVDIRIVNDTTAMARGRAPGVAIITATPRKTTSPGKLGLRVNG